MGLYALTMVVHTLESTGPIHKTMALCLLVCFHIFFIKIVIILYRNHSIQNVDNDFQASHTVGVDCRLQERGLNPDLGGDPVGGGPPDCCHNC